MALIVRIELTEKNAYRHCSIETEEGGILHVICEDPEKRNDLICLIGGRQVDGGICVLNGIDTKEHLKEYKKKVDIIDIEKIDSTLPVKDYMVFYTMVTGIYTDKTIDEITALLIENEMKHVWNMAVNELSIIEKIKVRCIAAYMKEISCLVGKSLLDGMDPIQREKFYAFLKEYFIKKHCLCLLFDNMKQQEKEEIDHTLVI